MIRQSDDPAIRQSRSVDLTLDPMIRRRSDLDPMIRQSRSDDPTSIRRSDLDPTIRPRSDLGLSACDDCDAKISSSAKFEKMGTSYIFSEVGEGWQLL
jgi:hypothetical protein